MADVFDRWLEYLLAVRVQEGTLKRSAATCYRSVIVRHLKPAFGHVRSDCFTLGVVESWRAGIAARIAAGTMAPKYWANIRNVLHAILAWARHPERRYLAHDPLADLEPLRLPRAKTRPHFELAQVAALLAIAARTPPDDTILKVAAFSGLRRGELFALQWGDVDPGNGRDGGRLHVRRSVYHGEITAPKTEDSARVVDVPQQLLDDLAVYKLMHPPMGEGFIFRQESGQPLDPESWHQRRLIPILEAAGLRLPMAGLHSLRHGYVSLLVAQGEDIGYIADQGRHHSTKLTHDVYRHVLSRTRVDAMRRLGAVFPPSSIIKQDSPGTTGTGRLG
jgi:integrase